MTDNSISMFSRYAELNRDDWVLFFFILFFIASARHLLIFSSGIKVIDKLFEDKLFEEKLAEMLFFYNFVFTFMI